VSVRITWWGHATATIELGGVRILTDPVLTSRLAHLRRIGGPAPTAEAAVADAVVVSHLHADHLHLPSLRQVGGGAALLLPRGGGRLVRPGWSGPVHELDVGDQLAVGSGVRVSAVQAAHDGRRLPGSKYRGPALGYAIEHEGVRVWFAGDTGYFAGLADVGPVDLALVPVGGWGPTLGPGHLDPDEAAAATVAVRARHALPVHYGTFWPVGLRHVSPAVFERRFRAPGRLFADAVRRLDWPAEVHVLGGGEHVELDLADD
jgi:L-ascorbate metabolism protein UlaG (beta-lactamase superfamily)